MTEQIQIDAKIREGGGRDTRKVLSDLRAKASIPGVVYGGKKPSVKVSLCVKDLMTARKKGGVNAILRLKLGADVETVIVKDIQRHPVTEAPIHADFQRISLTEKIEAKVPVHIVGEAPGVKSEGGILQHELRVITVRALPAAIPQNIPVDISNLKLNDRFLVKDLKVGEGVEVLHNPEQTLVHVTMVKEEVIEVAPVAGAEGVVAEGAEPEVIAKGKKPVEGEEGEEAAPAEKGKAPAAAAGKAPAAPAGKAPAAPAGKAPAEKPGKPAK
ncbi:MAG: 50S ribosomal protein L25 [Elusimicrobia bacterium]|nr:50S ribosomal protein L25 [Elusimicrobiota bacterium]